MSKQRGNKTLHAQTEILRKIFK